MSIGPGLACQARAGLDQVVLKNVRVFLFSERCVRFFFLFCMASVVVFVSLSTCAKQRRGRDRVKMWMCAGRQLVKPEELLWISRDHTCTPFQRKNQGFERALEVRKKTWFWWACATEEKYKDAVVSIPSSQVVRTCMSINPILGKMVAQAKRRTTVADRDMVKLEQGAWRKSSLQARERGRRHAHDLRRAI